ncbi:calcium and integrin-binding family member 3-like [Sinocyclocheilus rhinocerous]|uniref:calcium and integrin-binding family member 3-like n=1 Tax=Sinocyclocheilus rhinocerous TaxID=307959 RepID=UPI0007BA0A87|nr:PREDICTED: calcium and integrin-binding family member 3-like [Sinocyclocheilus rhinocerous]
MGNKQTIFTSQQLDAYQDCTYFTRKEILRLFHRYRDLAPQLVPLDYTNQPEVRLPYELIGSMPELKDNPFRQRIAEVFSEDGEGNMTLDDFLDMFSVLSEMAPRDLKAYYAFKIYGRHEGMDQFWQLCAQNEQLKQRYGISFRCTFTAGTTALMLQHPALRLDLQNQCIPTTVSSGKGRKRHR